MKKNKVKLPRWLAIKNSISQYMVGEVKGETEKAILFSGKAYAEERTHCMRCSKVLTHPSSKLLGYGPICCDKLGINWPNKEKLSEEEIQSVKKKIEEIDWEGWLPKSQIEIGEYEVVKKEKKKEPIARIGINASKLKSGKIKIKGIALYSRYKDAEKCREIKREFGGRWSPGRKRWHYPLDFKVVDFAEKLWRKDNIKLEKSNMLKEWYEKEKEKRQKAKKIKEKEDVKPSELDTDLTDTLYDFQRVGTKFLAENNGAILADDMGLGKTITSIAACDHINASKILVICPATLKINWKNEIQKWLPGTTTQVLNGNKKKQLEQVKSDAKFIITNYASIREKSRKKVNGEWTKVDNPLFEELNGKGFDVIILDEAHRAKNRKSQQTKALYKISKNIDRVYHLTGTPIMNKPDEIWSLLHIIDPVKYSSFWNFVRQYCEITKHRFGTDIGEAKNPKEFREMLAPLMIRRLKEEVIEDMPDLTINQQQVKLEGKQRKLYEQMEKNMIAELGEKEKVAAPIIITKILRLKQISVSAELLKDEPELKHFKKSAKIKALMDILEGAGEQKVVIFTQFKKAAKMVAKHLKNEGCEYGIIHGDVSQNERQAEVEKFQNDPNCKIFIATIKAGGLGITLTAGNIAVFLDKDWVPANNTQAVDRLHRIGQKDSVNVIELLAKDTVEEYIEELLEKKQKTFDSLIEGKVSGKEVLMNLTGGGIKQ